MRSQPCDSKGMQRRKTAASSFWTYVGVALFFISAAVVLVCPLAGQAFTGTDVEKIQKARAAAVSDAYLEEGKHELQRGKFIRAIRLFSEAIRRGAGIEAYKLRSHAYYGTGRYAEAVADMTRVLQSGSVGPDDFVMRGDAFNALHDHRAALRDYKAALDRDPLWIDAYRGRGTLYMALERYDLAIKDFQVVIQNAPQDSEASFNMGVACMLADLPVAARSHFQKVAKGESDVQWKEIAENLLAQLPQTSQYEESVGGLTGYLSRSPGSLDLPIASRSDVAGDNSGQSPTSPATETGEGEATTRRRPPPKGLLELRKALGSAYSRDKALSGDLAGSYMGFRWTFRFETRGRNVSATIRVQHPTGKEETHLCTGTIDGSFVAASDQDGYRFQGRLTEDLRLVGQLTTNHGRSFSVNMPLEE